MTPTVLLKRALQISLIALLSYLALAGVFLAAMGIAYLYPPLFVLALALKQDDNLCSVSESFRGSQGLVEMRRESDELASQCRLLEEDPDGYQLWSTP
jgi:hypothetical protein